MTSRKKASKTWEELEAILATLNNDTLPKLQQAKSELVAYHDELLVGTTDQPALKAKISDAEAEISRLKQQAAQSLTQILTFHKNVFGETGNEAGSLKKKIEDVLESSQELFDDTEEKKEEFDTFYDKVFGVTDKSGKVQGGLKAELEKYTDKYETLFTNIETLLPGATSAGLSEVFARKVKEYKDLEKKWSWSFIAFIGAMTIYFSINSLLTDIPPTFSGAFLALLHELPFLIFAIWLAIFIGNRRAESKKLEESYTHKETMSRSYIGYKQNIQDLEDDDDDKVLLKTHMSNLLEAIKEDSGKFLNEKGDNHPVIELCAKWLSAKKSAKEKEDAE